MTILPGAVWGLSEPASRLTLAGIVIAVVLVLFWVIGWIVPRLLAHARTAEGPRSRQRQTAIAALATSLRYVVLLAGIAALAFALAGGGGVAAVSGGALVVVVIGFASQRLLLDVIAGFFILFEDQYGVGDLVRLEPSGYTGRVRVVGLRTTVLSGPGGERMIVPNGQITAVHLMPRGHRRHRIELLTREPDAVMACLTSMAEAVGPAGGPWASPPRVVRHEGEDGLTRLIAIVDVDVHREGAASWLADAVARCAGDALAAPPLVGRDPGSGP